MSTGVESIEEFSWANFSFSGLSINSQQLFQSFCLCSLCHTSAIHHIICWQIIFLKQINWKTLSLQHYFNLYVCMFMWNLSRMRHTSPFHRIYSSRCLIINMTQLGHPNKAGTFLKLYIPLYFNVHICASGSFWTKEISNKSDHIKKSSPIVWHFTINFHTALSLMMKET